MKRIMMLLVSVFVLAAASAGAATYTVVKGDCLSKIAVRYHVKVKALHAANTQIVNPDRIYPGQILTIPTAAVAKQVQVVETEFTPINSLGQYPFGPKRDGLKAIGMFSLPEEVKRLLIAKVRNGEFEWTSIKQGDRFSEMVFGNYKIVKNKYANWSESHLEAARLYKVEFEGVIYLLFEPLKCYNWSWWSEEVIKPPAEKPPETAATPPPPPELEEDEEEELLAMIPPPVEIATQPSPEQPVQPEIPGQCVNCRMDTDIAVGVFVDRHQSGNNPRGVWAVGSFYACDIKDGDKTHSVGFALEGNYWSGVTGEGYNYYGKRYTVDAAYRMLTPDTEFQVRAGLGQVDDWGNINTNPGEYQSDQTSKIATAYVGFEKKQDGTPWFNRVRYYAQADLDIDRSKSDQWVDATGKQYPLNGEASNKTMVNIGVDGSVYKINETVSLAAGASLTHYQEGSTTGLRISPGVDFYGSGTLIGNARINPTYWSTSDHSIGLSVMADLTNLYKYLREKFASPPEKTE